MRTFGMCACVGALAFVLAGYQGGLFREAPQAVDEEEEVAPVAKAVDKKPVKARFPQDLAPAARAEPVPQAADYNANAKIHKIAIVKTNGGLYQDWQEKLKEEWQADTVEETSLVIVVGAQKKMFIEKILYPNGAPPIDRFKYQLEASVVEAKTGKVLANRQFINVARNIVRVETWDTTALGSPVEFRTVFQWAASGARAGFPPVENPSPIVNVVN